MCSPTPMDILNISHLSGRRYAFRPIMLHHRTGVQRIVRRCAEEIEEDERASHAYLDMVRPPSALARNASGSNLGCDFFAMTEIL
jgi:hypothetical protein